MEDVQKFFEQYQASASLVDWTDELDIDMKEQPLETYSFPSPNQHSTDYTVVQNSKETDLLDIDVEELPPYSPPHYELGSEPTDDRGSHRVHRGPRIPRSIPPKSNMLIFWLRSFKKSFKTYAERVETSLVLQLFLTDKTYVTPNKVKQTLLFYDPVFFISIKDWFERMGKNTLRLSHVEEEWKMQHYEYFQQFLKEIENQHSSLESAARSSGSDQVSANSSLGK